MGTEIERKFLVDQEKWKKVSKPAGCIFRQGYLLTDPGKTIRVRLAGTQGFLCIKGLSNGAVRKEYEYLVPEADAIEMLDAFAVSGIIKTRYVITIENNVWEVDEFMGENEGLVIAEIELDNENQHITVPDWVSKEVTADERYYNSRLSVCPYTTWK